MDGLDELRGRIRSMDERLVELVAERVEAAREAGRLKRNEHLPIRDFDTEREVVERLRSGFDAQALDPELGEAIARILIAEALRVQEADGLQPADGAQGKALVVGGAGRMGRWFCHFLNGLGYEVAVFDPAGGVEGFETERDLARGAEGSDLVVVSTPPLAMPDVLDAIAQSRALIFDIASLKGPVTSSLRAHAAEQRVASVHPLWGPSARVLSGKNVLVLDCGNAEATAATQELFGRTAAAVHTLPLDAHDPLMALTLGLPHALNLAYADVLTRSGHAFDELKALGGPTFLKQSAVAAEVASEHPELYRQIQALSDGSKPIYEALHAAIEALSERVNDPHAFEAAMREQHAYFGDPEGVGPW